MVGLSRNLARKSYKEHIPPFGRSVSVCCSSAPPLSAEVRRYPWVPNLASFIDYITQRNYMQSGAGKSPNLIVARLQQEARRIHNVAPDKFLISHTTSLDITFAEIW